MILVSYAIRCVSYAKLEASVIHISFYKMASNTIAPGTAQEDIVCNMDMDLRTMGRSRMRPVAHVAVDNLVTYLKL